MLAERIPKPNGFLCLDTAITQKLLSALQKKKEEIVIERKDEKRFSVYGKLQSVKEKHAHIKSLQRESAVLKRQQRSMELIFSKFVKKQRKGLTAFLEAISKDMNDFYMFMNVSEEVDKIELIPLDENDEFVGITIQFKFHGNVISPPNKYLSESHLNCIGICLFLSSVKVFNKRNKFFVLDDVISSFDRNHRAGFARLLVEKFSDYQILLFTHEKDWFEYVANIVKGTNWKIRRMYWNCKEGANIETPLVDLKSRIEDKIGKTDSSYLGNMIRRYLESLLKEICFNLEVKMKFVYNFQNENRMCNELLSELKHHLKNKKCNLKNHPIWNRLNSSNFIGNKTSHDSMFSEDIADLKVFYKDVLELENLLICNQPKCGKYVSKKHYDSVENMIRCSCGTLKYRWQE